MPRPLRIIRPGAWYHITARGIERRAIFADRRDNRHFLELLEQLTERFALKIHAYALMGNHYHLLIELGRPNLSRAIQWLNLSHSAWFNHRHQRAGYLFQGRFKSIIVDPTAWALPLSAYIHLNPTRIQTLRLSKADRQRARAGAGQLPDQDLVQQRIRTLREHPWTSYAAYMGTSPSPTWLTTAKILELGGGPPKNARSNYRHYVENQIREGSMPTPWEELRDQIILGSKQFAASLKTKHPAKKRTEQWPCTTHELSEVIAAVEKTRGITWETFKNRHADGGRDLVLLLARRATNLTTTELAEQLGLSHPAIVSMSIKRHRAKLATNRAELKTAETAAQMLNVAL